MCDRNEDGFHCTRVSPLQGSTSNSKNHLQDGPAGEPGEACLSAADLAPSGGSELTLTAVACPSREPRSRCGPAVVGRGEVAMESGRASSARGRPTRRSRWRRSGRKPPSCVQRSGPDDGV